MSEGDFDKSVESLYSQDEELNPLGHELISRPISLPKFPQNLDWSST